MIFMKLTEKEREGKEILLDGAAYIAIAASSALAALLLTSSKKPEKMKKKLSKNYKRINGALSGVTDKAALKWLEKDVKAHPDKYTKRDKGIHIDPAEIIDI